jgi:hypothetical protein
MGLGGEREKDIKSARANDAKDTECNEAMHFVCVQ